eukprot:scaffold283459_cov24-Prasinocladus_malaysianus.AAC.1
MTLQHHNADGMFEFYGDHNLQTSTPSTSRPCSSNLSSRIGDNLSMTALKSVDALIILFIAAL